MNKKYIIGFGTGRCGTMSLANLINSCNECTVYHELDAIKNKEEILNWRFDFNSINKKITKLKNINNIIVGDVALYYLNYIEYLNNNLDNIKFIYMWRNKKEVVDSYMIKTGKLNHWWSEKRNKNYNYVVNHRWNIAYPKFNTKTKEEAIARYWEVYHEKANKLMKLYDNIYSVYIEDINNIEKQKELFDFLNIPKTNRRYTIVHANKRRI